MAITHKAHLEIQSIAGTNVQNLKLNFNYPPQTLQFADATDLNNYQMKCREDTVWQTVGKADIVGKTRPQHTVSI